MSYAYVYVFIYALQQHPDVLRAKSYAFVCTNVCKACASGVYTLRLPLIFSSFYASPHKIAGRNCPLLARYMSRLHSKTHRNTLYTRRVCTCNPCVQDSTNTKRDIDFRGFKRGVVRPAPLAVQTQAQTQRAQIKHSVCTCVHLCTRPCTDVCKGVF